MFLLWKKTIARTLMSNMLDHLSQMETWRCKYFRDLYFYCLFFFTSLCTHVTVSFFGMLSPICTHDWHMSHCGQSRAIVILFCIISAKRTHYNNIMRNVNGNLDRCFWWQIDSLCKPRPMIAPISWNGIFIPFKRKWKTQPYKHL